MKLPFFYSLGSAGHYVSTVLVKIAGSQGHEFIKFCFLVSQVLCNFVLLHVLESILEAGEGKGLPAHLTYRKIADGVTAF